MEDDFRPSRSKRKKPSMEPEPIPTYNSFGVLQPPENDEADTDEDDREETPRKEAKPPPIVVTEKINDYTKCIKAIIEGCTDKKTRIDYTSAELKIYTLNTVDYMALLKKLRADKMAFYTYAPKELRPKHIVAKRLPNLPAEEIIENLRAQGIKCRKVSILKKKNTAEHPYMDPIYKLDFDKEVDMKEVWAIRYICHVKVKWEKYRNSRRVTQCHNCQTFGHGTLYCKNNPKCVKCDGTHLTKDCVKPRDHPAKCVNCGGPHPANYSNCPEYIKHLAKVQAKRNNNKNKLPAGGTRIPQHHIPKNRWQQPPPPTQQEFPPLGPKRTSPPQVMQPTVTAWTRNENTQGNNEHLRANADMSDYQMR